MVNERLEERFACFFELVSSPLGISLKQQNPCDGPAGLDGGIRLKKISRHVREPIDQTAPQILDFGR